MKLATFLPNRLTSLPVLLVLLLAAPAIGQTTNSDVLSAVDPAAVGISAERLGQMEQAIKEGDFKEITSVLIARRGKASL